MSLSLSLSLSFSFLLIIPFILSTFFPLSNFLIAACPLSAYASSLYPSFHLALPLYISLSPYSFISNSISCALACAILLSFIVSLSHSLFAFLLQYGRCQ
jgi:hypothetical protein